MTDPLNRQTSWGYNAAGDLTSRTDARGIQTSYGYDADRRQTSVTYPGGSVGFAYNAVGERTQMTDPTGQTTYTYDSAGRVTAVSSPRGQITYTYDSAGRRASMALPGNRTVTYAYNTRGLLSSLTDWQGRVTTFDYDSDGNRTKITRPNGVVSTYAYDPAGHVTSITHKKGGTTLLSFVYTYDNAGRRTSVTTPQGTESYTYDALGRLTQVSYPGGPTVSYTYDAAGNRKTETRGGSTTNYAYDAAGQLVTVGNKTYTYDANGNLTQAGSDSFAWDYDNRLTQATVAVHSASYAYDGDGARSRATVDGNQSNFLVDTQEDLPTLVDDGSKAYVHADGALSEIAPSGGTQLLTDALGSVRGLADTNGRLVASRSFEAFGTPRTTSGTSSLLGFTGEPTDATGLVFLRARSLDPATGRFISSDSVFPNAPGTQGYNLYAYVANNPATWLDPTGHSAVVILPLTIVLISIFLLAAFLLTYDWFRDMWLENSAAAAAALTQALQATPIGWTIEKLKEWWQREPERPRPAPCIPYLMPICTPGGDDRLPIFMPGGDTPETTEHIVAALQSRPDWSVLTRAEHPDSTTNREWYEGDPRCPSQLGDALTCDEYPFFTSRQGGPPDASLKNVPGWEQNKQGGFLGSFYRACGIMYGDDYAVVPMPELAMTTFKC